MTTCEARVLFVLCFVLARQGKQLLFLFFFFWTREIDLLSFVFLVECGEIDRIPVCACVLVLVCLFVFLSVSLGVSG